jgi:hypothetical protein
MNTSEPQSSVYEAPALTVLGTFHELTELQDKKYASTDGFTFMGTPIGNASP